MVEVQFAIRHAACWRSCEMPNDCNLNYSELLFKGGIPYPGISNKEFAKLLKTGYRMEKPDMCSDEM